MVHKKKPTGCLANNAAKLTTCKLKYFKSDNPTEWRVL